MKSLVRAAIIAAASWAMASWLANRSAARARPPRKHVETWENEGGALAPQHTRVETSQVPR